MIILSIDPGMSTGIVLSEVQSSGRLKILHQEQTTGGLVDAVHGILYAYYKTDDRPAVICEKFTPRPHGGGSGFDLKQVEPLRIEGYLVGTHFIEDYKPGLPVWRQPHAQYFCGGDTQPEKRKRAKDFLRQHDLYVTGKEISAPDSEDVTSAMLHTLGYLRDIRHRPSLDYYFKGD